MGVQKQSESVPITTQMFMLRNQIYLSPFDEFDPHHRVTGKKTFVP